MRILQKQPNAWSCTPTAFAMAVGFPVDDFISRIGHDGSEELVGGVKAFHIQECIVVALQLGFSVTPIEFQPVATPDGVHERRYSQIAFATSQMDVHPGVLTGLGQHSNKLHVVAWHPHLIYDPAGMTYDLDDSGNHFLMSCFWRITEN